MRASVIRSLGWSAFAGILTAALTLPEAVGCSRPGAQVAPGQPSSATAGSTTPGRGTRHTEKGKPLNPSGETEMAPSEELIPLQQALVLRDIERMGISSQRVLADITEILTAGSDSGFDFRAKVELEDSRDIDRLVLLFPAESINGLRGCIVFSLHAADSGPLAVRRAAAFRRDGKVWVRLETKPRSELVAQWAYSRRPAMRAVLLAGFDDPQEPLEAEIFHAAEFRRPRATPLAVNEHGDWTVVEFELSPDLIEESTLLDSCEQLLENLDNRGASSYLEWTETQLSAAALEEVSADAERRILPSGQQFNVTLESGNAEMIRGKRLQPMVRYPITLIRENGTKTAASLGCSISNKPGTR